MPRRLREEGHEFEAILGNLVRPYLKIKRKVRAGARVQWTNIPEIDNAQVLNCAPF